MTIKRSAVIAWALGLCLAAALAGVAYLARSAARQSAELERLSHENVELRALAEALRKAPPQAPAAAAPAPPVAPPPREPAEAPDQKALVERLHTSLADAHAALTQLDARVHELQVEVQNLSTENKRLAASETELNDNLASANRLVTALQSELKSRNNRVVQLEVENGKLRDQTAAGGKKMAQVAKLLGELQEVHRQRESLLEGILRRYREVTNQYRTLAGALEDRGNPEGHGLAGADVARIQDSISQAEDDLRQLSALNAQALRLEKQLVR